MNRRGFLSSLAAAVLDPEKLLWVPGKKMISIPSPRQQLVSSNGLCSFKLIGKVPKDFMAIFSWDGNILREYRVDLTVESADSKLCEQVFTYSGSIVNIDTIPPQCQKVVINM